MATFDQLPAEQRAILELVLQRRQSYGDLGDMLGMPTGRVRELARAALTDLSPRSAGRVDPDWRGQVADYLLGQQTGPESTATRGHLRRSEAARLWALSLLDSLDHLYREEDLPVIPEGDGVPARERPSLRPTSPLRGDRERPPKPPKPPKPKRPSRPLSADAEAIVRRRRIGAGVAATTLVLLALLVWPIGLLTGDDDDGGGGNGADDNGSEQADGDPELLGQLLLRPEEGEKGVGRALITEQDGKRQLLVQAAGLRRTGARNAYEVWLYNSADDAFSMGAQLTDRQGNYQGAGELPEDYENYEFLDISRETRDQNSDHSGVSVLRGRFADLQESSGSGELEDPGAAPPPAGE